MRKTKIICTLGPAVDNPDILEKLMLAGMDVARINFSHGNYEEQQDRIERVKEVRKRVKKPISLLLDTKGPEIRIGKFANDEIVLENGDVFTLTNEDILGNKTKVSITYKNLYNEVQIGTKILINDGTIETIVKKIDFLTYYTNFTYGMLNLTDIIFFLSVTGLFLFFTARVLEKRRWS